MKKIFRNSLPITLYILTIFTQLSCSKMFDSLKEFADKETIYPASFDTIGGRIGFNRVEIDLSTKGRVFSNELKLAKAVKTIVESSYFKEPLVIDTVCSWINLNGLTEPEEYTFKIYTVDSYGNRSIPKEVSITPFTSQDLEQLELISPRITASSSSAVLEWENVLSGVAFDCYGYSYKYTDKDGTVHIGTDIGDRPNIILENLTKEQIYPIEITLKIIPKKNNAPIIDTVHWTSVISLKIPENVSDAIFLKTPISPHKIDLNATNNNTIFPFSWAKAANIESYTLKISNSSAFDQPNTISWDLGNVSSVDLSRADLESIVTKGSGKFFWTVVPTSGNSNVVNQIRSITIYRPIKPTGVWLFDEITDPFKATVGTPLSEVSLVPANRIQSVSGPTSKDHAVFVPERSYLTCFHGIDREIGDDFVHQYTLSMRIKVPSFKWFSIVDIDEFNNNGEFFISPSGEVGIDGFWNSSTKNISINTWHNIVYAVDLDNLIKVYIDGQLVKTITTGNNYKNGRYALRPNLYLFRDDATWNNVNTVSVSEVMVWKEVLNETEVAQMNEIKLW